MLQLEMVPGLWHILLFLCPVRYDIVLHHAPPKPRSLHQLPVDTWQTCCALLCTLPRSGAGAGEQGQKGRRRFQDSFLTAGADSLRLRVRSRGRIRGISRTRCCTSTGASQHCSCRTQRTFRAAAATRYQDVPLLQIFCR